MKASTRPRGHSVSKGIVLMSISNHLIWSSHHVLSRYLQVQAQPPMDGMIVLSTGKLAAMIMTYFWGEYVSSLCKVDTSPEDVSVDSKAPSSRHGNTPHSSPRKSSSYTALISSTKDDDEDKTEEEQVPKEISEKPEPSTEPVYWTKTHILLLNAVLTTTRASLNVVSAKYAKSYNLSLINSSVIFLVPLADRFFLKATLPKSLWYAVFWSIVGSILIALSHVPDMSGGEEDGVLSTNTSTSIQENSHELYGCCLQMISCIFIVAMRLLIRMTEGMIKPTELVQAANIGTFLLPALYVTCIHPSAWDYRAFFIPTNLLIWFILSFLIFFFAATAQVALVQSIGPGYYSSFTAIRIVGAVALSSLILNETIRNSLEGLGIAVNIITMTIYLLFLYKEEWGDASGEGSSNRKNSIETESKLLELPDIEEKNSMNDSHTGDDHEAETSSPTKSEYHRLVKRK